MEYLEIALPPHVMLLVMSFVLPATCAICDERRASGLRGDWGTMVACLPCLDVLRGAEQEDGLDTVMIRGEFYNRAEGGVDWSSASSQGSTQEDT